MDELERIIRGWLADLCRCRAVSDSLHEPGCAAGHVGERDIDALYDEVLDWHDDLLELEAEEVAEELKKQREEAHTKVEDDPE